MLIPGCKIQLSEVYTKFLAYYSFWNTLLIFYLAIFRPLKKVLFDTTGFLGAQNLTQEQRDSRQNLYDNRSKEQCFEAICEHITAV